MAAADRTDGGGLRPALGDLTDASVELVHEWLSDAATVRPDPAARQLADVLRDPAGLAFTLAFVDEVVRIEDVRTAAAALARVAASPPAFLPAVARSALAVGGRVAPVLPVPTVPIARRTLRRMVGHLVLDADPHRLGGQIARLRASGMRLNINLLGEAVQGEHEAARRRAGTIALIERPDVDYVSIKVSSAVAPHSHWGFAHAVDAIVEALLPVFRAAQLHGTFVNLDMEEYRDLDLTIAVFERVLDRPEFAGLAAGIVLQAYLPDALGAMQHVQTWSAARRARGGAPVKVRLVKGANLPMEQVEAVVHGWPLATWGSKRETDTNYKRVLDWALTPERMDAVHLGVAGHNLFDVASAWLLAGERGVRDSVEFEMLLGMASAQADVVRRTTGGLRLYTPIVSAREFDTAIAYLVRRLDEGASSDNYMSAAFDLDDPRLFAREEDRFRASAAALDTAVPVPNRVRRSPTAVGDEPFRNVPDADPSVAAVRDEGVGVLHAAITSDVGSAAIDRARVTNTEALDAVMARAGEAAAAWAAAPAAARQRTLHRMGDEIDSARLELIEVMVAETAKTIDQADPEVSEAADFAHHAAHRIPELSLEGASFAPAGVVLVVPPWNFPVSIPAGGVLSALAAGNAVVLKPAPQARRCGAVLVDVLRRAGLPDDVLTLVDVEEDELGERLIAHPRVDRVLLTGAFETAERFRSFRTDLPLLAETSGKNAIVVTPSADIDLAVRDVVASAFGNAGQKCSAASLVILVGAVARSRRFRDQLADATRSLAVGLPTDPATVMGPLVEPASGKALSALTELGAGEHWLVRPRRLDEPGRLWSPGVRSEVAAGSWFHLTECFAPVLGVMRAATLDEAIALQNAVPYGLTAGLHSLDDTDIARWLDRVQAGNLYVNRGTTGAIVGRQPFGGWKRSSVGPGAKAGGPNTLIPLGSWHTAPLLPPVHSGLLPAVRRIIDTAARADRQQLTLAASSDQAVWDAEFGMTREIGGLRVERNLFRYRPAVTTIRVGDRARADDVVRVVLAGVRAGADVTVSAGEPLGDRLAGLLREAGIAQRVEPLSVLDGRIRAVGVRSAQIAEATGGRVTAAVWDGDVTATGRIELLPFLREQSISITAHRYGRLVETPI